LAALVLVVLSGLRELGRQLVRMVLEERDAQQHQQRTGAPQCPHCGRRLHKPRRKDVERLTLLGRVRYWRYRWLCAGCQRGFAPLETTLGLAAEHAGHSGEAIKELALLCALHAFEQGCQLFERCFGCPVSTHLAYRVVMRIGRTLSDAERRRAQDLWVLRHQEPERFEPTPAELRKRPRARRLYVMLDNSKVRIQEGKRGRGATKRTKQQGVRERFNVAVHGPVLVQQRAQEHAARGEGDFRDVRALLIYQEDDVAAVSKGRRALLRRRVLAHVGTQEQWLQLLHLAFHEEGVYLAREVVVVADGGAGIWEAIDELLPSTSCRKVVEILDWCHAVSHLWAVAKQWKRGHAKKQVQARAQWVDGLVKYLADGQVSNVVQRLQRLRQGKQGELAAELERCLEYFETHRVRMRYRQFRDAGMTIGSGAIESVHKWVIQARCMQAGMAWSEQGINAMLRLRCAWASGRWDDVFAQGPPGAEIIRSDSAGALAA
jgi:DNA-directed RNA polymerase subunit RPC12/RpoP